MKGQISIDYIIAIVIFIFFVIYFLFEITNIVPKFIGQIEEQEIRSKAYQISEILINDPILKVHQIFVLNQVLFL